MDSIESKYSSDGSYVSQNSDIAQQARIRFEQVDQRLSCAVCLDRFRDPRLLECTHSFCKQCLLNVIRKRLVSLEESQEDCSKGERELHCPRCRNITFLDAGGVDALPINYDLQGVVEAMPEDTSSFSPSTPVLPFGRTLTAPVPLCEEHLKPMEYFCQNDEQLVCPDCVVMNRLHKGHDMVIAKHILEKELENLRHNSFETAERMLLKLRESVDNVSNMADSLKEKGEMVKSQIHKHFKEIRDALEEREQSLLNTTDEIIMRKVTKLEMQKEVLTKSKDDMEVQVLKLKHILANKNDYSFLRNKQKLISDIAQLVELAESKERVPMESTKDGPNCYLPNDLLSSARTFGEVYCKPHPSKFTARGEGLSKGFIHKSAKFRVEARDRYGQRSVVSGSLIKVLVQGPNHATIPTHVEEISKGEYLVSYTPTLVGYHLIRVTADGVKILNGDSHAVIFNKKDYFSLGVPHKHISKTSLASDPPISTMRSICTLPCGLLVFTDAFCLRVVHPARGQLVLTIGSYGTSNGQFSLPLGLAVNRQGHIFVSDSTNHRIEKFTSEGRHMMTFASHGQKLGFLAFPEGLDVLGDEKLYVADCGNDRIQIFNQKSGKSITSFGKKGSKIGQFSSPRDLAVDVKNNRILVSDTGNYRIQALTLDGKPLTQFGNPKGGSVYLNYPYFVTVDDDGFILVTETRSHFFTILTPRGALVRHVGSQGDSLGQFRTPYGICVNQETGQVIVTDSTNHCIQIF